MHCYKCANKMITTSFNNVDIDLCHICKSLWFTEEQLNSAKEADLPDIGWFDFNVFRNLNTFQYATSASKCPSCEAALIAINCTDSDLCIDHCSRCRGFLLNIDNYQKLITFLEDYASSRQMSDYLNNVSDELKLIAGDVRDIKQELKNIVAVYHLMVTRFAVEHPGISQVIEKIYWDSPIK